MKKAGYNISSACPVKGKCFVSTFIDDSLTFGFTKEFNDLGFPDNPCELKDCTWKSILIREDKLRQAKQQINEYILKKNNES